jgi:hypothetical protein
MLLRSRISVSSNKQFAYKNEVSGVNRRILVGCLLAPVSLFCALPAAAEPYFCEATGHYYEVVEAPEITWDAARTQASDRTFAGGAGELATITSAAEDSCVEAAWNLGKPNRTEVWIGGFQPAGASVPGDDWEWVNGDEFGYTNWQINEPNDNYGPASEQHLAVGLGGNYGWNDEGALGNIGGYIVEYETAVTLSGSDCNPSCVYNGLEYSVDIEENEFITFQSFFRTDNDDLCGIESRPFSFETINGTVISTEMAKYLCGVKNPVSGNREFVAVVVSKSFESLQAADIQTDPSEYFEFSLACNNPIPGGIDLRNQDIAHFATDLINDMPRKHSSDATYDCGSSRGKVKGTVLFIGTQYVFKHEGQELDWTGNPESVEQAFIGVTRDRVEDLIKAIDDAKPGVPKKHLLRWLSMRVAAGLALWSHDQGYYSIARAKVNLVNQILPNISFNSSAGSAPAFIDIWGSHLVFMYDVKVIPYAP